MKVKDNEERRKAVRVFFKSGPHHKDLVMNLFILHGPEVHDKVLMIRMK